MTNAWGTDLVDGQDITWNEAIYAPRVEPPPPAYDPASDLDSWESPAMAEQGLSTISGDPFDGGHATAATGYEDYPAPQYQAPEPQNPLLDPVMQEALAGFNAQPYYPPEVLDSWESPQNFTQDEAFSTVSGEDIGGRRSGNYMFDPNIQLDPSQIEDLRYLNGDRLLGQDFVGETMDRAARGGGVILDKVGGILRFADTGEPVDPSMYQYFGFGATGQPLNSASRGILSNPNFAESNAQFDATTNPANRGGLDPVGDALRWAVTPIGPLKDFTNLAIDATTRNRELNNAFVPTQGASGDNVYGADRGMVSAAANLVLPQTPLDIAAMAIPAGLAFPEKGIYGALGEAISLGGGDELQALPDLYKAKNVLDVPALSREAGNLAETAGQTLIPRTLPGEAAEQFPEGIRIAGASDDVASAEPSVANKLLGLDVPEPALTTQDKVLNSIKRTTGYGIEADETATPIMRERQRALNVADNEANRAGSLAAADAKVFPTDDVGRITSIPGNPTIQDVAAKLPQYDEFLTPAQRKVLEDLRDGLEPYRQALEEAGVDVRSRGDIIDGGFYLPRGRADIEGLDEPNRYVSGMSRGGKKGFEKSATFESMAQGIEAGYSYAPFGEAIKSYVRDASGRIVDKFTANSLLNLTDDAGNILAETAADRVNPALRDEVTKLRSEISQKAQTLARQGVRGRAQRAQEERVMSLLADIEERINKRMNRLDSGLSPTAASFKKAEAELRVLDQMANRVGGTAQDIGESAMLTEIRRTKTQQAVDALRAKLDDLSSEWERAQRVAQETPRGQGRVQMAGLQSYTFPEAMAEAINKELRIGAQRGPIEEVIKAVNNLLRPISATADLSFMGIQGLIGAVDKPLAYGSALKAAVKSLFDENAVGAFIKTFDENAVKKGVPTSRDWVKSGLRIGGSDTEFTIGKGVGGIGQRIQRLPVIKQTNQAFGTFGDALRLAMADAHYTGSGAGSDMSGIAAAVNRATGSGTGRFAGDLGDLATFAPRYFQSQLEMIAKSVSPSMGAEANIARKQLVSLLGAGALLTVGANEALGNKFDYTSPMKNGYPNSNFMRIRIGGQDVSLFAGWDSLFRAMAYAAQGDPGYLARTKASPVVSHAWDILSGSNFIGDPVNFHSKEGITNLMKSFLPFSTQQIGTESPLGTGLNLAGVKSSPLTVTDQQFEKAESIYGKDFVSLDPEEQAAVNASLVQGGTALPAYKRRQPYEDAREKAFEVLRENDPVMQDFNTLDEFRADFIKEVTAAGVDPADAGALFTKKLNELGHDDLTKAIRKAVIDSDPDIIDSISNPSKEMREFAAERKAAHAK